MPLINAAQSADDEASQRSSSGQNKTHTETPDDSEDDSQLENKNSAASREFDGLFLPTTTKINPRHDGNPAS